MMKFSKDFNITGRGLMESFLGMQVEQKDNSIKLHLDHYVQEMLTEYKDYIKKSLRIKRVPMNPALVLHPEDCPAVPDPHRQKFYALSWPSFSLRLRGFALISRTRYHSWHGFAQLQVQANGLLFII